MNQGLVGRLFSMCLLLKQLNLKVIGPSGVEEPKSYVLGAMPTSVMFLKMGQPQQDYGIV